MSLIIPDDAWGLLTVWQEARGEPFEGKVAVAEVILRRTRRKYFSDGTVAGTCLAPLQFSGWNAKDPNRIKAAKLNNDDHDVQDCIRAYTEALAGSNYAPDAMHYFNPKLCSPDWARGAKVVAEIGQHRFVIPKEG